MPAAVCAPLLASPAGLGIPSSTITRRPRKVGMLTLPSLSGMKSIRLFFWAVEYTIECMNTAVTSSAASPSRVAVSMKADAEKLVTPAENTEPRVEMSWVRSFWCRRRH
jgi:hypothetical protein